MFKRYHIKWVTTSWTASSLQDITEDLNRRKEELQDAKTKR